MEHSELNFYVIITKKEVIHVLLQKESLGQAEKRTEKSNQKKERKNGKQCLDSLLSVVLWAAESAPSN